MGMIGSDSGELFHDTRQHPQEEQQQQVLLLYSALDTIGLLRMGNGKLHMRIRKSALPIEACGAMLVCALSVAKSFRLDERMLESRLGKFSRTMTRKNRPQIFSFDFLK